MSGLEVIGGISAVIAIIDASVKVWDSARKDLKFSTTFETVANRLPILRDTLQICYRHLEPIQNTLPGEAANSLSKIVTNCERKAENLHTIFKETITDEDDQWYDRYRKIARRLGKGNKVEELMQSITEDAQNLVNYHAVKSAKPELCAKLEQIIMDMKSVDPSLPSDEIGSQTFNTSGGPQYVSTGNSTQYNSLNTGSGDTHYYGGITGNPVFNIGTVISGRNHFIGSYAYSSLRPVVTYIPRLSLEQQLEERLPILEDRDRTDESRTVVIWGLGGAGKSQLALNYIHKHRQKYQTLFWVEAGQKQTLERDFVQIHKLLFPSIIQNGQAFPVEDAITAVKTWFYGQEGRSLLVLDSVDVIDDKEDTFYIDLNRYLPDAPGIDIIITTRSSQAQSLSVLEAVAVSEMTQDEAVQLFRKCAKLPDGNDKNGPQVLNIVQELGCFALAVTLAGSYIFESPWLSSDLQQYLVEYRAKRQEMLSYKARSHEHRYDESISSTWEMSFAAVERRSPIAARLLNLVAFLNYDDIFLDLFAVTGGTVKALPEAKESLIQPKRVGLRSTLTRVFKSRKTPKDTDRSSSQREIRWTELLSSEEATISHDSIKAGFKVLQAYSLVSWRADQQAYAMHKLVHTCGHDRLDTKQRQAWSLAAMCLLSEATSAHEEDLLWQTRIVPHVVANFSAMSIACGLPYQIGIREREALSTLGELLGRLGRWNDEYNLRLFEKESAIAFLGLEHPETLRTMNNLASVLAEQGEYKQAEAIHRQTLALLEKLYGLEYADTLSSMNNLGFVLNKQGEFKQAEAIYRQTLALKHKLFGLEHLDTLISMSGLALVLGGQGKYKQAEAIHRQTLEVRTKLLGLDHPETLRNMNNLALVLAEQGEYKQAETIHRQTLELEKKALGLEHPNVLRSMNNLALVLVEQGKYKQAEAIYRQALALHKKVLGIKHPNTLVSMSNLAQALSKQGEYREAEAMYKETIDLEKKVLGLEHPSTLLTMNNLAQVLSGRGEYKEAEAIYRQTLGFSQKVLGIEHPCTLICTNNLASILHYQGEYQEAEAMYKQTLEIQKQMLGLEHPNTLICMNNLAQVLSCQGEYTEAEAIHKQTLELQKKVLGVNHPHTLLSLENLTVVLRRQEKNEEAEVVHQELDEIRQRMS